MSVTPYHRDDLVTLYHGDCIEVMRALPDSSVDAVVTDPPYELGFMGKSWDGSGIAYSVEMWSEVLRVLKPGGHLISFGGCRTWHRMAVAIEDSGFQIRENIAWLFASGFPKSLDVSKAIDKAAGAEVKVGTAFKVAGEYGGRNLRNGESPGEAREALRHAPATPEAARWQGWGTAMKPAHEPVVHGVKPFDNAALLARIGSQLDALEDLCRRHVSDAAEGSAPTRHGSPAARTATAPESAATPREAVPEAITPTGAAGASSAATDTSASESTAARFLSTVTSWRACWVEISEHASTSTTSTETSRTTDLRTLSSCLSQIMQSGTATSTPAPESWRSLVTAADNLFAAGVLNSRSTRALSALDSATATTPPTCQDEDAAPGSRYEPIVVARKPLIGTVAANVLAHGTGALNVDGCRVGTEGGGTNCTNRDSDGNCNGHDNAGRSTSGETVHGPETSGGRWPANVILDESQARALDAMSGVTTTPTAVTRGAGGQHGTYSPIGRQDDVPCYGDTGGASRFFYTAKADSSERPRVKREGEAGTTYQTSAAERCVKCGKRRVNVPGSFCVCEEPEFAAAPTNEGYIAHPTVKPLDLMRYLVRLVTPPGGVVLEPFAGSGTTLEACIVEGFSCIGIEREADYIPLIMQRITKPIEVTLL